MKARQTMNRRALRRRYGRPSRGGLWTITYRGGPGRGVLRVAVVRAFSESEALGLLRNREGYIRDVETTRGHDVPGYPEARIIGAST